jgi:hypothetical protein
MKILGFATLGKNFAAVANFVRTKSEGQIKSFYQNYKGKLGLESLVEKKPVVKGVSLISAANNSAPSSSSKQSSSVAGATQGNSTAPLAETDTTRDAEDESSDRTLTEDEEVEAVVKNEQVSIVEKKIVHESDKLFNGVLQLPSFLANNPSPIESARHHSYSGASSSSNNNFRASDSNRKFSWPFLTLKKSAPLSSDSVSSAPSHHPSIKLTFSKEAAEKAKTQGEGDDDAQ